MELVAPFQKTHLMLTLSQYNDSDEHVLARAEIHKDQAFFPANTNTYIAASSFRISGFGALGYIYQYLKPKWFIAGESRTNNIPGNNDRWVTTSLCLDRLGFGAENVARARFVSDPEKYTVPTNSLNAVKTQMARDLNAYRVTQNSIVKMVQDGSNYVGRLATRPADSLRGPGEGQQGLFEVRCNMFEFRPSVTGLTIEKAEGGDILRWGVVFMVNKSELPDGYNLRDFKEYFSRRIYLYPKRGDFDINGPMFHVLGPCAFTQVVSAENEIVSGLQGPHAEPMIPIWCDRGQYYQAGGDFNYEFPQDENPRQCRMDDCADWASEDENVFTATMCITWATEEAKGLGMEAVEQGQQAEDPEAEGLNALAGHYYCYTDGADITRAVHCTCDFVQDSSYPNSGSQEADIHVHNPSTVPLEFSQTFSGSANVLIGRTFLDQDFACMTPNQMYEIFNVKDPDAPDTYPWYLQTHSNGGFSVKINKAFDNFKISKDFCDSLGLVPEIVRSTLLSGAHEADTENRIVVIPCTPPGDQGVLDCIPIYGDGNFTDQVIEAQSVDFTTHDGRMISDEFCRQNIGIILQRIGEPEQTSYYQLLACNVQNALRTRINSRVSRTGVVLTDPIDGDYYNWDNVEPGDIILNSNEISVESFSLFEGLQIVCPSLPFSPMITTYSSGMRVLCEIRLSYEYSGNSDESGRVISTADSYVGDIVWNANNFQYLQLQSVGKIYNLECRVQLVYRDCNRLPPKPVFIPPRGIFQCKVRLLAVK